MSHLVVLLVQSAAAISGVIHAGIAVADPVPIDPDPFLKAISTWVTRIAAGIGGIYATLDLIKHLSSSPRDLRSAGFDLVTAAVLIGVIYKAEVIVAWAQHLF